MWVPIAFASSFLNDAEAKHNINELEISAVVWSVEYFKNYTYGGHFASCTDQRDQPHWVAECLFKIVLVFGRSSQETIGVSVHF